MSTPGVGAIVSLTVACAIDDPARFKRSKMVGAHFGLTPKKYQSGETDITGRISKIGDEGILLAKTEIIAGLGFRYTKPSRAVGTVRTA